MHTEMKIGIKLEQIDWTHRTGSLKKDDLNKKSTLITVKFVRYTDRRNILSKLLNQRRNDDIERSKGNLVLKQYGFKQVWTTGEKMLLKEYDSPSTKMSDYYAPLVEFWVLCLHEMHYFYLHFGVTYGNILFLKVFFFLIFGGMHL